MNATPAVMQPLEPRTLLALSPLLTVPGQFYADRFPRVATSDALYVGVPVDDTGDPKSVIVIDGSQKITTLDGDPQNVSRLRPFQGKLLIDTWGNSKMTPWISNGSGNSGALAELPAGIGGVFEMVDLGRDTVAATSTGLVRLRNGSFSGAKTVESWKFSARVGVRVPGTNRAVFFGTESLEYPNTRDAVWSTDGTTAGSWQFNASFEWDNQPLAAGKYVYFIGTQGINDQELWFTDGGFVSPVRDVMPGERSSNPAIVGAVGDTVYFTAYDESNQQRLWRTDGTGAGTRLVTSFPVNVGTTAVDQHHLGVPLGNLLFFPNRATTNAQELWVTDGTEAGTRKLRDVAPGTHWDDVHAFTPLNGRMYFAAGQMGEHELWRSDGTADGTVRLTSFNGMDLSGLTAFNGAIYFIGTKYDVTGSTATLYRHSDSSISILGTAFNDLDADGARDAGEPALANVRVYIDANNNRKFDAGERSELSDAKGRYNITSLSKGKHYVRQVPPTGSWETTPSYLVNLVAGDHVGKQFGSIAGQGVIAGRVTTSLQSGGNVFPAGVSGFYVWADLDRDGKLDANEPRAITDDTGRYLLTNLSAKTHTIRVVSRSSWQPVGPAWAKVAARGIGVSTANFAQIRLA